MKHAHTYARLMLLCAVLFIPTFLIAQTWYVDPGAVIPTNNAADTALIVEHAPTASFVIDFNTGGAPRLYGDDLSNTLSVGFDFAFSRGWGSGGFSFAYEATYRIYLLPTNNSDVWIVAMDYSTKAWGWSRSGTLYLWKVDKNNPSVPISTSANQAATPPASPSSAPSYNDYDANGWDDDTDLSWIADFEAPPSGYITYGPLIVISSGFYSDTDGWFNYDSAMLDLLEFTAEY